MKSLKSIINEGGALSADAVIPDNAEDIVRILQECYAEEVFCWYKYFLASRFLAGADRKCLEELFEETGKDELEDHASRILERLNQFDWSPEPVMNVSDIPEYGNHVPFTGRELRRDGSFDTVETAKNMLEDEASAIRRYAELERLTRKTDPVTNRLAKDILKDEEEHYQELEDWLKDRGL